MMRALAAFWPLRLRRLLGYADRRSEERLGKLTAWWLAALLLSLLTGVASRGALVLAALVASAPLLWMLRERLRSEEKAGQAEAQLPVLLRETASYLRAGLSFDESLARAASHDGVLFRRLRTALSRNPGAALMELSSGPAGGVFALLGPASRAGSVTAALLEELARYAEEGRSLRQEFQVSTKSYSMLIAMSAVLIMPVLLALSLRFLRVISGITPGASGGLGLPQLVASSLPAEQTMAALSVILLLCTVLLATLFGSVARGESIARGVSRSPLFLVAALAVFLVARGLL